MDTLALGGALAGHTPRPRSALGANPPLVVSSTLELPPLELHDPLVGEDGGRNAAGQGGESLVVRANESGVLCGNLAGTFTSPTFEIILIVQVRIPVAQPYI